VSAAAVLLTAAQAAAAMAGSLIAGPAGALIGGISIDTRTLEAGDVYVAIIGERLDGHRFVADALRAGAAGLVVSDASAVPAALDPAVVVVQVDDTTRALQRLGRHIRRASRSPEAPARPPRRSWRPTCSRRGTACSATAATSTTTSDCRCRWLNCATAPRSRWSSWA
jgi:hypothetical protein